ncbi:MAG TPA: helicase-related protein [Candidatus Sulfotelmatobacter sp.]
MLDRSRTFLATQPLTREFTDGERTSLTEFILDWTFRFRRWAISPAPMQLLYTELDKYSYQDKSVGKLAGDQYSRTTGFSLKQDNPRNRTLDFYKRLCKRQTRLRFAGDLPSYKALMENWWDQVMAQPEMHFRQKLGLPTPEDKPFLAVRGTDADTLQLKLSWSSLRWRLEQDCIERYRCDSCGYITRSDILHLCPVRDCSGSLKKTTIAEMLQEQFSPARHYLTLLKTKAPKPLNIEEHTAQISPIARREIEESFRREEKGSTDIISGSTTFELGIDLGTVSAVFLANMPPEVSNYRQRAGRAGRRTGMLPLVMTYVRERPHDSYFWSNPDYFIAGPLRVPRFSLPSYEVLLRHVNATVFSALMQTYPTSTGLQGPSIDDFISFATQPGRETNFRQQAKSPTSDLWKSLKSLLDNNPGIVMTPEESLDHFYRRLRHFQQTYLVLVSGDGTISTLSDYGILPSYNYPIYVDELRLYEWPRTEGPRKNLKLQRDRSISLNEYFPGRIIVAGKLPIRSVGLWNGFKYLQFKYCRECSYVDTRGATQTSSNCPNGCGVLVSLSAVRPLGGFVGRIEKGLARQDPDLFSVARSQFLFDPAGNPPPPLEPSGRAVNAAKQTSFNVEKSGARMRTFVPRPDSQQSLELAKEMLRDVAMPGTKQLECLVIPTKANGEKEKHFLMHEFTTDILRLQIKDNEVGRLLLSSDAYQRTGNNGDGGEKKKGNTILLNTLIQALATAGARILQIDPREIATTFRFAPTDALLRSEAILFDTAPGGAGYCDQLFDNLKGLFEVAIEVLDCKEGCGDSCYSCLRSFDNQGVHTRLNRFFVLDGLKKFVEANWL